MFRIKTIVFVIIVAAMALAACAPAATQAPQAPAATIAPQQPAAAEKPMTSGGYTIPVAKCAPNCTLKDMTVGFIQTGS